MQRKTKTSALDLNCNSKFEKKPIHQKCGREREKHYSFGQLGERFHKKRQKSSQNGEKRARRNLSTKEEKQSRGGPMNPQIFSSPGSTVFSDRPALLHRLFTRGNSQKATENATLQMSTNFWNSVKTQTTKNAGARVGVFWHKFYYCVGRAGPASSPNCLLAPRFSQISDFDFSPLSKSPPSVAARRSHSNQCFEAWAWKWKILRKKLLPSWSKFFSYSTCSCCRSVVGCRAL